MFNLAVEQEHEERDPPKLTSKRVFRSGTTSASVPSRMMVNRFFKRGDGMTEEKSLTLHIYVISVAFICSLFEQSDRWALTRNIIFYCSHRHGFARRLFD